MPMHYRNAAVWRNVAPFIRSGGVWRTVQKGYYRSGGVWREFFSAGGPVDPLPAINLFDLAIASTPVARVTLASDGNITTIGSGSTAGGDWYSPITVGVGASHWGRVTVLTGTGPDAGAGVWQALTSGYTWTWTGDPGGAYDVSGTFRLEIATDSGGTNIVATESSVPWRLVREL